MSAPRMITEKNFLDLYPLYERRLRGEKSLSTEIQNTSMNSSYIFALIDAFINH